MRRQLSPGDLVVFFCAREQNQTPKAWDYFYIGFGTVEKLISRISIWSELQYSLYRSYFNILIKYDCGCVFQYEPFGLPHDDWEKRAKAGYVLFAHNEKLTDFNIINPLYVATYIKEPIPRTETWFSSENELVNQLEECLLKKFNISRRLRSTNLQRSHPHIRINKYIQSNPREVITELRNQLFEISKNIRLQKKL